jgi:hypothetical protein
MVALFVWANRKCVAQLSSHKNKATILPITMAMGMMISVHLSRFFTIEKCSDVKRLSFIL